MATETPTVVPSSDSSTDAELIEHLDWAPICEYRLPRYRCEEPATHRFVAHHTCCGHRYDRLACRAHLDRTLDEQNQLLAEIVCAECGHIFKMVLFKDIVVLDSVTPLSGES